METRSSYPGKWDCSCCDYCGQGSKPYINIQIATNDGTEFPYSETTLCKKCWKKLGLDVAFIHNAQCREISSGKQVEIWK